MGDVSSQSAALTQGDGGEGRKRKGKNLSEVNLDRLRSQIFNKTEPSNKNARSRRKSSRNERMKKILKQLLKDHFNE